MIQSKVSNELLPCPTSSFLGYHGPVLESLEGREGGRDRGREGSREGGREGGREGSREGGREKGREGGRKGGRERGREGEVARSWTTILSRTPFLTISTTLSISFRKEPCLCSA